MGKCQGHVAEVHAGWSSLEDPTCHTLCLEDIVKLNKIKFKKEKKQSIMESSWRVYMIGSAF